MGWILALGYTDLASTVITGQPLIAFKYSAEAIRKRLGLSSYLLQSMARTWQVWPFNFYWYKLKFSDL